MEVLSLLILGFMLKYSKEDLGVWQTEPISSNDDNRVVWDELLRCNDCDFRCPGRRELSRHLRKSHPSMALQGDADQIQDNHLNLQQQQHQHLCPRCGRSYKYRHHMRTHYLHECGKDPAYQCLFCDHKAKQKSNLTTHMFRKHPTEPLLNRSGYTRSRK